MKLIFASNNAHKAEEVRQILGPGFTIITLREAGIEQDIPEPHDSFEANAREKSMTIYQLTGTPVFSDDSGLEVDALGGAPGVRSARYAGEKAPASAHIQKLLDALAGQSNRTARFRAVISLVIGGEEFQFSGVCPGRISQTVRGDGGFGYDPVFIPDGNTRCFSEMPPGEKNRYSHRARALEAMQAFLDKRPDLQA